MKLKPFIRSENYENEYGALDYKGKKVLDLGADYGSSAEFFIEKGAREVIAVEGHKVLYGQLVENCKWLKNVTPISLFLRKPDDFIKLILEHKPDIVKSDLDGFEIYLLDIPDEVFSSVKEYTMEIHSMELLKNFIGKFLKNGYQIIEFKKLDEKKSKDGIFCDGILITCIRPSNSVHYFKSMNMLFKYWELSRRKTK